MNDEPERATTGTEPETVRADLTLRPKGNAEVRQEPDGTFEFYWPDGGLRISLLLDWDQSHALTSRVLDAQMNGRPPKVRIGREA